jgi:uncharacterized protein
MRLGFTRYILFLAFVLGAGLCEDAWGEPRLPKSSGPVNDFADTITQPYEKKIGTIAKEMHAKTGVALFVVTMRDLEGADPKEYANRLYNDWGFVRKTGEDRGVLILVSVREQKMHIRTGNGLQAILSPRQLGEIQDRFVAPLLKKNNYDDGLLNGVVAIAKIIGKEWGVTLKSIGP